MRYLFIFCLLFVFGACQNQTDGTNNTTTSKNPAPAPSKAPEGMVWVPGGTFDMGSNGADAQSNEGPIFTAEVAGFWMDATEVTNAGFKKFIEETGYVTVAERPIDWEELKAQLPPRTPKPADSLLQPGSLTFYNPGQQVSLHNVANWWKWTIGANWRHPNGPDSDINGKDNHPVVHIAHEDAAAYAKWAGKRLPTEAEWEYASRGGEANSAFAWGDELTPNGKYLANFYQGDFPNENTAEDGFTGTAPVKSFVPNHFGLYDMIGNVWEWTSDWYRPDTHAHYAGLNITICKNPTGPEASYDPQEPMTPKRVIKGGSFLCSKQYCSNYRPSARMASDINSGLIHLGFRCVKDAK